jgi:hypothetical protein
MLANADFHTVSSAKTCHGLKLSKNNNLRFMKFFCELFCENSWIRRMAGGTPRPRCAVYPRQAYLLILSALTLRLSADRRQTSTLATCERIINGRFIITRRLQLLTLMPFFHSIYLAKRFYSACLPPIRTPTL